MTKVSLQNFLKGKKVGYLVSDTRVISVGDIFLCQQGQVFDGHNLIDEALKKGCIACIATDQDFDAGLNDNVFYFNKEEVMSFQEEFLLRYKKPQRLVGVTGTNGKGSVVHFMNSTIDLMGIKACSVGTMGVTPNDTLKASGVGLLGDISFGLTTPDNLTMYKILDILKSLGVEDVFIEVSSIGIETGRVVGLEFEFGAMTNFSQDHLDFHGSMNKYLEAKMKLFGMCKKGIVRDDIDIERFELGNVKTWNKDCIVKNEGVYEVVVQGKKIALLHDFIQSQNLYLAILCLLELGLPDVLNLEGFDKMTPPLGRMTSVKSSKGNEFVIDYAHTPDALELVSKSINHRKKGRLIIVFGCGGDRDLYKRPLMGKVASNYGDVVIVTDDNPRFEDAGKIRADILAGISSGCQCYEIGNRLEAIKYAHEISRENDIILLAGKGHETYQVIGSDKSDLNEFEIVKSL